MKAYRSRGDWVEKNLEGDLRTSARMRCDGGSDTTICPEPVEYPSDAALNGLLEGTSDSRFATLFALRKARAPIPDQIYPHLIGGGAGTRLAHPSSVLGSIHSVIRLRDF
jgi:hypothetical protein